jgi:hypothetical protein
MSVLQNVRLSQGASVWGLRLGETRPGSAVGSDWVSSLREPRSQLVELRTDDVGAHRSTPSSRVRLTGASSALASSVRISRSSRASLPFA